jgi:putative chitinase
MSFFSKFFRLKFLQDKLAKPQTPKIAILMLAIPGARREVLEKYLNHILETFEKFDLSTIERQAAFLSQCAHESANFSQVVENLNYSKEALLRTWPKHFADINFATPYHRNPQMIANRAYRNRMGNGDEASGDGWKYRGRGFIQITGKNNYRVCGDALDIDLMASPELLETSKYAVLSAGWFWHVNHINDLADDENTLEVTRRINGGTNGLTDRISKYDTAKKALLLYGKL